MKAVKDVLGSKFEVDEKRIREDKGLVHGRITLSEDGAWRPIAQFSHPD